MEIPDYVAIRTARGTAFLASTSPACQAPISASIDTALFHWEMTPNAASIEGRTASRARRASSRNRRISLSSSSVKNSLRSRQLAYQNLRTARCCGRHALTAARGCSLVVEPGGHAGDDGGADGVFGTPVGRVDRKQIATFVAQHKHRRERQEENHRRKRSACHMSSRPAAPARRRKSRSSSEPAAASEHTSCPSAFQCPSSGSQSNCVRCSR